MSARTLTVRVVLSALALLLPSSSIADPSAADVARDGRIAGYLTRAFPATVTDVRADDKAVRVTGTVPTPAAGAFLAEVPVWGDPTELGTSPTLIPIAPDEKGHFTVTTDRTTTLDGRPHDRLASRWAIVRKQGDQLELLSAARWADEVVPPAAVPSAAKLKSKKGLGGFHPNKVTSDLDDLGIGAVTVNIVLTSYMRTTAGPGRTPFEHAGRSWWVDDRAVAKLDQSLAETAKRNIVVSAIILVPLPKSADAASYAKTVAHPDADPSATFAMPNLTTRDGCEAYAAALAFLSDRYGRAGGTRGRIHHYILHNEVDMGWIWTNAGEKPVRVYLEMYHRSMRLAHLLARRFDPNAKAFISLTHHWAKAGEKRNYAGRELLELLVDVSRVEGDFDWAIAQHPYPQDLRNPRVWEDTQATFSFDTPKVTLRNIEVLDAWARQPRTMFLGKRVRTIHLSEQGFNSPDYSERSLRDQAAGVAYAWAKVRDLPSIEAFQYHNWIDNRHEGGLRIGLRRFPDDETEPLGEEARVEVYRALGTPREAEVTAPFLGVVGAKSWDEVRHRGEIRK